jgi:hypothetical protein
VLPVRALWQQKMALAHHGLPTDRTEAHDASAAQVHQRLEHQCVPMGKLDLCQDPRLGHSKVAEDPLISKISAVSPTTS